MFRGSSRFFFLSSFGPRWTEKKMHVHVITYLLAYLLTTSDDTLETETTLWYPRTFA